MRNDFRRYSSEAALLKVSNDLLMAADDDRCLVLVPLEFYLQHDRSQYPLRQTEACVKYGVPQGSVLGPL